MPRVELSDRFVAGAKTANKERQTDYFDSKTPGLVLRVSNRGSRTWGFFFTAPDGKRARTKLGSYPAMSLSRARGEAKLARGHAEDGADPRAAMKRRGIARMTVAELVDRYVTDPDKARLRSIKEIKRRLDVNALPIIGDIALAELTRRDVRDVTDKIMRREARTQAWHTHKDLSAVLRWAVRNDFLTHNPVEGVKPPGGFTAGERTLSDEEIAALWHVLPTALAKSKSCQRILKLCLITGQRLGEVSGMTKAELDLQHKLWSLPGIRVKNKHAHSVPLSDLALTVITEALADAGKESKFVFPVDNNGSPLTAPRVTRAVTRAHEITKERPQGRFGISEWSVHDLRRTCLNNLAKLGVLPHVIAHVANHRSLTKSGVTFAHYVSHSYEAEKRKALDLWAERLSAVIGGGAVVVPMRGRR